MNCSIGSEYDNLSSNNVFSQSAMYQAFNNVLSVTTTNGNRVFCPLCATIYEFKFSMLDHLRNVHLAFLSRADEQSLMYEQCIFCYANFLGRHTIVKHVLHSHTNIVTQFYLRVGNDGEECIFCSEHHSKKDSSQFISHIEKEHFLQFRILFEEQFMSVNETRSKSKIFTSDNRMVSASTASKEESLFNFSCLKEQLQKVEQNQIGLKSILKSKKQINSSSLSKKTKARRILKFDMLDENKENSVFMQNINSPKQITFAEHSLLCNSNTMNQSEICNSKYLNTNIQPLHSSTPKIVKDKIVFETADYDNLTSLKSKKNLALKSKPTFKSYFGKNDFFFQCSKCKKQFQDNSELNWHIKKSHKMFIVNFLHPCYQCAICKAKFFKNYYLKKHIILHSSYTGDSKLN